jgi:hypothetical protein
MEKGKSRYAAFVFLIVKSDRRSAAELLTSPESGAVGERILRSRKHEGASRQFLHSVFTIGFIRVIL